MPSFVVTVPDIHVGPGFLWWNVQAPAAGARLLIDANGNPTQGAPVPMGGHEGVATLHIDGKYDEISIDQETAPVDAVLTAESARLEINLKESSLIKITKGIPHSSFLSGTDTGLPAGAQAYEEITVGGLVALPQQPIALISPRRGFTNPGKFMVFMLYKAFSKEAFQIGFTRTKESIWKLTVTGLADLTRAQGDRVAQLWRQT